MSTASAPSQHTAAPIPQDLTGHPMIGKVTVLELMSAPAKDVQPIAGMQIKLLERLHPELTPTDREEDNGSEATKKATEGCNPRRLQA